MNNRYAALQARVVSAVIAVVALIFTGYFAGALGLAALSSIVLLLGMVEYLDIGFCLGTHYLET